MFNFFVNKKDPLTKFIDDNYERFLSTFKDNDILDSSSDLFQRIYNIIKKEYIYVYHATRIDLEKDIYDNGIIIPDSNKGLILRNIILRNVKNRLGDYDKYSTLYSDIKNYSLKNKHDQLWFTITNNPTVINIENHYYFYEKYGGEFLEDVFGKNKMSELYNNEIKNLGKPKLIKFRLKIAEIDKRTLSNLFVYIIQTQLGLINKSDWFITAFITKNISPNRIEKIEDYKGEDINV